jgi:ABC-type dipeptide/oligopeptide/nickel transport system ATPase subunit
MARVLSAEDDIEFIFQKLFSSLNDYNHIKQIFIVGHPNCTGNKIDNQKHIQQVKKAAQKVRERFPDNLIVSLWVSDKSIVEKII